MVAAVRRGASLRSVARRFHVSLSTVQRWVGRAEQRRLDRVDLGDRVSRPHCVANRTDPEMERAVLAVRKRLSEQSILGECGAKAIREELLAMGSANIPSVRTIGRILERRGVLDGRHRIRRNPPPRGWYLPDLATRQAELDSFDIVEGLVIQGGPEVEVLNASSLHGGLVASWPMQAPVTTNTVLQALREHWQAFGTPTYAQFDNDLRFHGPHRHPDTIGRVTLFCLALGVTPVFVPPHETGFQAAIENYNGRWQQKVWSRFHHASLAELQSRSARYIAAHRQRAASRIESAPSRAPFPATWPPQSPAPLQGRIVFLRRTDNRGQMEVLGRRFPVDPNWPYRLVRCVVDLGGELIHVHALRRRDPDNQPLLLEVPYSPPAKYLKTR